MPVQPLQRRLQDRFELIGAYELEAAEMLPVDNNTQSGSTTDSDADSDMQGTLIQAMNLTLNYSLIQVQVLPAPLMISRQHE